MERAIELFAAINFLVIGLSHIFMPKAWAEFFMLLGSKGQAGAFINGFLTLGVGSLIVAFHNVWTGVPVFLTVIGWLYVAKALVIFVIPGAGLKSIQHVTVEKARRFRYAGVPMILMGIVLIYCLM